MTMAEEERDDDLPTFKRDAGGMLSRTERDISKNALDANANTRGVSDAAIDNGSVLFSLRSKSSGTGEKWRRRSISRVALVSEPVKTMDMGRLTKSGSTVNWSVLRDCAPRKTSRRYLTG